MGHAMRQHPVFHEHQLLGSRARLVSSISLLTALHVPAYSRLAGSGTVSLLSAPVACGTQPFMPLDCNTSLVNQRVSRRPHVDELVHEVPLLLLNC